MAISFDANSKRIILDSSIVSASEIWSRWCDWVSQSDNSKFLPACSQVGGDNLGSGISIPIYIFLLNGWRVRPMEMDHDLTITGNLFVDVGGSPVVRTLGPYQVNVKYVVPVQAQAVSTSGGSTAAEIWSYANRSLTDISIIKTELSAEINHLMSIQNGLTNNQATMLLELYRIMGLDPTKPLLVTNTSRTAGSEINQTIISDTNSTSVTRV